jgi:hypothetical protein
MSGFTCAARAAGKTDPPQDCDWPFCGCDPHATKVIEALDECNMLREKVAQEAPTQANSTLIADRASFIADACWETWRGKKLNQMSQDRAADERDLKSIIRAAVIPLLSSSAPVERPQLPPSEETQFWAVTVSRNGDDLVTIETNCLSGKPEFSEEDARVIRMAAEHLSAFIGPEEREPFIPCDHDYVWVQETVLNGTQYRCDICGHVKWEKAPAETQEERAYLRGVVEAALTSGVQFGLVEASSMGTLAIRQWIVETAKAFVARDEAQPSPETLDAADEALVDRSWEQFKTADEAAKGSPRDIIRTAMEFKPEPPSQGKEGR